MDYEMDGRDMKRCYVYSMGVFMLLNHSGWFILLIDDTTLYPLTLGLITQCCSMLCKCLFYCNSQEYVNFPVVIDDLDVDVDTLYFAVMVKSTRHKCSMILLLGRT